MKKDLTGTKKVQKPKKRSNRENGSCTKKPSYREQQDSSMRLTKKNNSSYATLQTKRMSVN